MTTMNSPRRDRTFAHVLGHNAFGEPVIVIGRYATTEETLISFKRFGSFRRPPTPCGRKNPGLCAFLRFS